MKIDNIVSIDFFIVEYLFIYIFMLMHKTIMLVKICDKVCNLY